MYATSSFSCSPSIAFNLCSSIPFSDSGADKYAWLCIPVLFLTMSVCSCNVAIAIKSSADLGSPFNALSTLDIIASESPPSILNLSTAWLNNIALSRFAMPVASALSNVRLYIKSLNAL